VWYEPVELMEIGLGECGDCMPTCYRLCLQRGWTRLELQCCLVECWASREYIEEGFLSCEKDGTPAWVEDVVQGRFVWLLWLSGHLPDDKV
jgi:hypothetical protein